ncbi:MAG: hypothetical protein O2917_10115 [Acidobacteria bacterium]|nr:hypothetical protein [Acidobacteriota bacterium]
MLKPARRLRAHLAHVTAAVLLTLSALGCAQVDLTTALEVAEMSSGFYDAGLTDQGLNKLVPSVTFRVKNTSGDRLTSVDLAIFFWANGRDGEENTELDDFIVKIVGSGSNGLDKDGVSEPVVIRSKQGYTLQDARAELFNHPAFRDVTAKLFLKRGGKMVPFGEFEIERRLLLAAPTDADAK